MKDIEVWLQSLEPYEWFCFVTEWNETDKRVDFPTFMYESAKRGTQITRIEENASDIYEEYYKRFDKIEWDFQAIETELLIIRLYHIYQGDVNAYRSESVVKNDCINDEIKPRWAWFSTLTPQEQAEHTENLIQQLGVVK